MIEKNLLRGYIEEVAQKNFRQTLMSVKIESIAGGENHWLYKSTCYWEEQDSPITLLVRIKTNVANPYERAKSEREARVLAFLNGRIAPKLFNYDASSNFFPQSVMCLAYIEGKTYPINKMPPDRMRALGNTLAKLHAINSGSFNLGQDSENPDIIRNPIDYFVSRWTRDISRKIPKEDVDLPTAPIIKRFWDIHDHVFLAVLKHLNSSWFDDNLVLSLLHSDLGSDNIIWTPDNTPVLIDWEYTRMGDPAEEIAYIFTENQLPEPHRDAFWYGYSEQLKDNIATLKRRSIV